MPRQRKPNDLSRSLIALDMDTTLIAVVELSLSSWLGPDSASAKAPTPGSCGQGWDRRRVTS
jgi:hypothetical protein